MGSPLLCPSSPAFHAHLGFFAVFDFLQFNTCDREPCNVEGIPERFVVLMAHAAVDIVDTDCPNLFTSLLEGCHYISAVHSLGLLLEEAPQFISERRDSIPA